MLLNTILPVLSHGCPMVTWNSETSRRILCSLLDPHCSLFSFFILSFPFLFFLIIEILSTVYWIIFFYLLWEENLLSKCTYKNWEFYYLTFSIWIINSHIYFCVAVSLQVWLSATEGALINSQKVSFLFKNIFQILAIILA